MAHGLHLMLHCLVSLLISFNLCILILDQAFKLILEFNHLLEVLSHLLYLLVSILYFVFLPFNQDLIVNDLSLCKLIILLVLIQLVLKSLYLSF